MPYTLASLDQERHNYQFDLLDKQIEEKILTAYIKKESDGVCYEFEIQYNGNLMESALDDVSRYHKSKGFESWDYTIIRETKTIRMRFFRKAPIPQFITGHMETYTSDTYIAPPTTGGDDEDGGGHGEGTSPNPSTDPTEGGGDGSGWTEW